MARTPNIPQRKPPLMKKSRPQEKVVDQLFNQGLLLHHQGDLAQAKKNYEQVLVKQAVHFDALHMLGVIAYQTNNYLLAEELISKAIKTNPTSASAFLNRGNALKELCRLDDALQSYDKAIAINPSSVDSLYNRGSALQDLKRLEAALESYGKAITLEPDADFLFGKKLHLQMHLCDWSELSNQLYLLESDIAKLSKVIEPFPLLGIIDNPELQFLASKIYAEAEHPALHTNADFTKRVPDGKIRLGYFSADFRNHVVSELIVELFELHNSDRFEVYGFSFGPSSNDEMRQRISNALYRFIDISMKSDLEVAQISRSLGIDIAIDLGGFTKDSRAGIFSAHSAPIQVNYLGYPGTMGASYMDYIVADKTLIPQDSQRHYSEKIVYLPHSFQVNDSKRKIADKVFTRQDLGLPDSGFVFCCFNNNYKIMPATFDVWMRLLKTVKASVLWLFQDNPTAAKNLRKEAEIRGIDPARLVFAPTMKLEEHLARHRVADLFIDTLPYNAHTTASDALWAGLPVLTQIGHSFAARVAASLLNAMDLPELITKTQEEYESTAVDLANNPLRLAEIKKKLELKRVTSPLFNGQLFARHIEAAYVEIHRRQLNGDKPEYINVETLMG